MKSHNLFRTHLKKKCTAAALGLVMVFTMGATSVSADSKMDTVISKTIGVSYKTGGTSTSGFDCSGFTKYVFKSVGLTLPRTSKAQYSIGTPVSKSNLRAGDLVFFNTLGNGVSHVGIYVGNGKFAQSSSSKGVNISSLSQAYWANRYVGAKRVMSTTAYQAVAYD
ncbi:cell wall-associated NlpC family hydrolase [Paenibacillus sp. PastF-1]|nr:cell wall-associated NlpC family hydrolase [Paenibacillus sp. PastF-2]MDF9851486.1 cell wall-associated NlpC family hydrolase [Paenibacillus sp. PastM-2]MDF9858070.1 cell wall-associated NlpC family hydrolase [Paenibacillus sp. PastF-1]MDH6483343.1 cell wall-associated NlpC family hydrolase [Paenibacillus sp. PastH-2]MDH6510752.1 cell wall-associated NlpC family hydrolase [Paenibacillus sp. PastM-3]